MLYIPKISLHAPLRIMSRHLGQDLGYDIPRDQVGCELESEDYTVTVNSLPCPVRSCRVSAIPFNRVWPGKQRDKSQTELASYVTFYSDSPVTVEVGTALKIGTPALRPLSKGVEIKREKDSFSFTLEKPGAYSFEPDGPHKCLTVFFNEPVEDGLKDGATYSFGPGLHSPGTITLRDGESVYIHPEAIVFGSVYADGAKNIRVYGGGILDDTFEERILEHGYEGYCKGALKFYDCENVKIEDIITVNSSIWVLSCYYCSNVTIDKVKIIGQWRYNTDGIDLVNTSHVKISGCYVRSFDDTVSIKGIYSYDRAIEDITVENCVFWCDWGHTCELGIETLAPEYKNVVFRNCDLIYNQTAAMGIPNGNYAHIHDILFEDMNVEFRKGTPPQIYQRSDDMVFDPSLKPYVPRFILLNNSPYPKGGPVKGKIDNVSFKNVSIFTDDPAIRPQIRIVSLDETVKFGGISVENVSLNGKRLADTSLLDVDSTEEFIFS